MPVLDKQRHSLLLKNTKTGKFDEIDNVKKIKDRSFIRARPRDGGSGIPMPGMKKAVTKSTGISDNKINNRTGLVQNSNQNNNGTPTEGKAKKPTSYTAKSGFGLKNPTRSLITSPERSVTNPRTSTPISATHKPNGNLSSFGYSGKPKTQKASPPSATVTQSPKEVRDANNNTNMEDAAQLHSSGSPVPDNQGPLGSPTGNGLGGGSVSKTGFSYHHGTGVPSFRKPESPSDSLKSVGKEGGWSAVVEGGSVEKSSPPNPGQKNKLQPLGAPLKGDIRKAPPNISGKRSIPTPKGKIYGSLIPSNKLKSSGGTGSFTAPSCGDTGTGSTDRPAKLSAPATSQTNSGLKASKADAPAPNRPKPLTGRAHATAPPPIAPKPTAARLASVQPSALPTGAKIGANTPSNSQLSEKELVGNRLMVDDFPPELSVFSNIKRPESPEPRATINGRGSYRSLRPKHALKPVSIPQVPALDTITRQLSDEVSKSDIDIRGAEAKAVSLHQDQNLTKKASQSAPDLIPTKSWTSASNLPKCDPALEGEAKGSIGADDGEAQASSTHVISSTEKQGGKNDPTTDGSSKASNENTTSLKRGLSSLKRFIPGRSSAKTSKSHPSKSSTEDLLTKPDAETRPKPDVAKPTEIVKADVHRSDEPMESTPEVTSVQAIASRFENDVSSQEVGSNQPVQQNHNSTLKKPAIPTTNLVTNLVKTGNDASRDNGQPSDTSSTGSASAKIANPELNQSVVGEINQRLNPNNMARKSNLVKTGSYNSVNSSDSSTSNTTNSSVSHPRQHSIQKKVSFQDNVMVSDGRGVNTYVQRLKTKEDETHSEITGPAFKARASAAEQLGIVATEADIKQFLDNHAVTSPVDANSHEPVRVMSPAPIGERKSAVEAAIETITGKPSSRKVTINDSYRAATQRPLTPSYQLAAQLADTVPGMSMDDGAGYYNYGVPGYHQGPSTYEDMWYPSHDNMPPVSYEQYPAQMRSMTPNPTSGYDQYPAAIEAVGPSPTVAYSTMPPTENAVKFRDQGRLSHKREGVPSQADPYFQTQSGFPYGEETVAENQWSVDTPPYYEGCGSWKRGQSANIRIDLQPKTSGANVSSAKDSSSGANDGEDEDLAVARQQGRVVMPVAPPADKATQEKVKAMERQIANLTGMVETMITHTDKEVDPDAGNKDTKRMPAQSRPQDPSASSSDCDAVSLGEVRSQMLKLRSTAQDLKKQLDDIKRQQRTNLERMSDMIVSRSRELTSLIATTAGSEHAPVRARRLTLDRERSSYGDNATRTERQLTDVEAAVEELRNEVVERRCRVNTREVEALALQLSQAGRTIANLKSSFPSLCDEMRTVGSAETEVIIQEEKFMDTEPARLDEQLKRCKQLTQTLFTLKKLATVQEARSKTPINILGSQGMVGTRPETPSQYLASLMSYGSPSNRGYRGASEGEDIKQTKNRVLSDVRSMRVDSSRRMQSLQDAEQRWTRRVKYIRQYDSRKMEKALELAEKALRKTNNIRAIDERRKNHFESMFFSGGDPRSGDKLTASLSGSSSVDSLSPPPPPMTNMTSPSSQPDVPPYASSTCSMSTTSSTAHQLQGSIVSPDGGYISSEILSPQHQKPSPSYVQNTNYEQPYQQGYSSHVQQEPRSAPAKHYQFRSNSLQRSRSQRVQQVQQIDDYQRQRSRTPNPFGAGSTAQYEAEYAVQYETYEQQYSYQQTYQDPYTQHGAYYGVQPPYQAPSQSGGQYGAQSQYQQYTSPLVSQSQPSFQTQPDPAENNAQSNQVKYAPRQLRKPTSFTSKLPSSAAMHKDPSPPHRSSSPASGAGGYGDGVNRRRGAPKPPQQQHDNNQRLKDQYGKSQQVQRKQKMFLGKKPPKPQKGRTQMMSSPMINPSAKSSDV